MEQEGNTISMNEPTLVDGLARATQALAEALSNMNGQFAAIHAKIDRIVAAIDDGEIEARGEAGRLAVESSASERAGLHNKLAEMEKANQELRAQSATTRRKTLSPLVTTLLAKEGVEGDALIETPVVEKALAGLSVEQRIAVKAELARAGILV